MRIQPILATTAILGVLSVCGCSSEKPVETTSAPVETKPERADFLSGISASEMQELGWNSFRGPTGQGYAFATDIPTDWSNPETIQWRTSLPGQGYSTPIATEDTIWVTTAHGPMVDGREVVEQYEDPETGQMMARVSRLEMRLLGISRETGEITTNALLLARENPDSIQQPLNSYASPSPAIADGKIVASYGSNGMACYDIATGEVAWTNEEMSVDHVVGAGSSPIIVGKHAILHYDGIDQQVVVAYDMSTGEIAWKTPRTVELNPEKQFNKAYSTPMEITWQGKPTVLSVGPNCIYAYDPNDGRELWKVPFPCVGYSIVPSPTYDGDFCYFSSGWGDTTMICIDLRKDQPTLVWETRNMAPRLSSPIVVGDQIYTVTDLGVIASRSIHDGEVTWKHRLGGTFTASPILVEGNLVFCNHLGEVFFVKPGPEPEVIATNMVTERRTSDFHERVQASPLAVDNQLVIRTETSLWCIRKPPVKVAAKPEH
ncbi:PQQ-binding-like beta-propeller repeat protein [Bremerella cremea]